MRASAAIRAQALMSEGVTTIEVKSGYGLELEAERRLLEVARSLERALPVSIATTYLGLHALPEEYRSDRRAFVDLVSGAWLEALAADGLVDAVDAFCESIAFSVAETEQFLRAAQALRLPVHLHAGQLSDMGAAELAAKYAALSADHLEYLSAAGAQALARSGSVAVLLPGAYFTLRQTTPPPVPLLRKAGVPIAVATDCNPGTSPCNSTLAVHEHGLHLVWFDAGRSLGWDDRAGGARLGLAARSRHAGDWQARGFCPVAHRSTRGTLLWPRRESLHRHRSGRQGESVIAFAASPHRGVPRRRTSQRSAIGTSIESM